MTEEQIESFLESLKHQLMKAKKVEFGAEAGIETTYKDGSQWAYKKQNGTFTYTIKINGGAMDT